MQDNNRYKLVFLLVFGKGIKMITYNDLCELLRKERYSEQLQPLGKDFLRDLIDYFKEKKEIASKESDIFSDAIIKTKKQFENAVSIFRELIMRRKKKLLNLAFVGAETGISKRDSENMLEFEKELFEKIMKGLEDADKALNEKMNGKQDEQGRKNVLVAFVQDVSEFLDLEGNSLGPFKKGDLANLQKEIANILIGDKKADLIED